MTRKRFSYRLLALALTFGVAALPAPVFASGFQLIEQNASGLGNAFAGQAAGVKNASAIYFNPAALTRVKGWNFVASVEPIGVSTTFADTGSVGPSAGSFRFPVPMGNDGGDAGKWIPVPNGYLSGQVTREDLAGRRLQRAVRARDRLGPGVDGSLPRDEVEGRGVQRQPDDRDPAERYPLDRRRRELAAPQGGPRLERRVRQPLLRRRLPGARRPGAPRRGAGGAQGVDPRPARWPVGPRHRGAGPHHRRLERLGVERRRAAQARPAGARRHQLSLEGQARRRGNRDLHRRHRPRRVRTDRTHRRHDQRAVRFRPGQDDDRAAGHAVRGARPGRTTRSRSWPTGRAPAGTRSSRSTSSAPTARRSAACPSPSRTRGASASAGTSS